MTLNLTIQGDPKGIRAVAEWLDPTLAGAAIEADLELAYLVSDLSWMWSGESGGAFNAAGNATRRATQAVPSLAKDLAEVMRAYAGRLERGEDAFDGIARRARKNGLRVVGKVIYPPTTWLKYCPGPDSPEDEVEEYDRYVAKLSLYNELSAEVGTWEGELEAWIYTHFGALMDEVVEVAKAAEVLNALRLHNELLISTTLESAAYRHDLDLAAWRDQAARSRQAYDEYKRNARSGNPARKAAAAKAVPYELRQAIRTADTVVEGLAKSARIIPGIGVVVDVGLGVVDVSQGGSPSTVGAGLIGSAAAGFVTGAVVSGPAGWVVGAAVVAGWAGGEAGKWLWEETVPLDVRESIDAWFMDAIDTVIFWD